MWFRKKFIHRRGCVEGQVEKRTTGSERRAVTVNFPENEGSINKFLSLEKSVNSNLICRLLGDEVVPQCVC